MRQAPHKRPPFYATSTKRVSYKVFCIEPFANALHEQTLVRLKESVLHSGQEEVEQHADLDPLEELRAAKKHSFWNDTPSEQAGITKRIDHRASLEVGEGEGHATREIELIWWLNLYSLTSHGKLCVRFFIKKVGLI